MAPTMQRVAHIPPVLGTARGLGPLATLMFSDWCSSIFLHSATKRVTITLNFCAKYQAFVIP